MKSLSFAAALLLLAPPAFAQSYPGDDDDSWNQQQPPEPPPDQQQGIDYGYGNTAGQPPPGQPPPGYDPNFRQPPMPPPAPPQQGPTYDDFQGDPALDGNGIWIDSEYGRVWRPTRVSPGWQPYLYGRWAWTDAGWAWISEEPFGWATYHYGRWAVLGDGGWAWLPGRVWAPAWVAWRYDDGYAAWCPLGPRGLVYEQPRQWVAVDTRHFLEPVRTYVVPIQRRQEIVFRAPVYRGPRMGPTPIQIGRVTHTEVRPLVIRDGNARHTEVNGGSVQFFRPRTSPVVVNRGPTRPIEVNRPGRPIQPYGNPHRPEVTTQQQPPRVSTPQPPPRVNSQPQPPRIERGGEQPRVVTQPQQQPPPRAATQPQPQPQRQGTPQPQPQRQGTPQREEPHPTQPQRAGQPPQQKQPPPRPVARPQEKRDEK